MIGLSWALSAQLASAASLTWAPASGFTSLSSPASGEQVTCGASGFCVAVGTDQFYRNVPFALVTTDPTAANATWNGGELPKGSPVPNAVSCPSSSLCVAVGSGGDALISTNPTASSPTWATNHIDATNTLTGVDCVSESLCVAIDGSGHALVSTAPGVVAGSWLSTQVDGQGSHLTGLSCTPAATCVAIDDAGNVYVTSDPAAASPVWTTAAVDAPHQLVAISCASGLCVTVDNAGHAIASVDPAGGVTAWQVSDPDAAHSLSGVSCPSSTECVAVDTAGNALVSGNPGDNAPRWTVTNLEPIGLGSVSCSSVDQCLAVDSNGAWIGTSGALGAPVVSTGQATAGPTSATLAGTVDPSSNAVTDCHFDYGPTTGYGSTMACGQAAGAGPAPVPVSAVISGLPPATTFHFRLVAANSYGLTDGQDVTFATTGASAATVTTGAFAWQWKDPTATLLGTVNPHNDLTTFRFFYGTASQAVSSVGDLTRYPSSTGPQPVAAGTNDVTVSAVIGGIQADTNYYYRLVAYNSFGATIGSEHTFTTDAPQPVNTAPPGLQDNGGFDPTQGFRLKCLPGTWTDSNGRFSIKWVHVDQASGTTVPAPGPTSTVDYPGDTYEVGSQDDGWGVGCVVEPYALDGSLRRAPASSELYVVTPPGSTILPPWLKSVLTSQTLAALSTLRTFYSVGTECVEFADLPGLGEAVCAGAIAIAIIQAKDGTLLKNQLDPPDRAYRSVALLPRASIGPLGHVCMSRTPKHACARVTLDARRYARASAQVVSILRAFYTAGNRFLIARGEHDSATKIIQTSAWKVYSGLMAAALNAQQAAGRAYARALRRAHIDVTGSAGLVRGVTRLSPARLLGTALVRRLRRAGVTRAGILSTLMPALRRGRAGAFDLRRLLTRAPLPSAPFVREYVSIGLSDIEALVFAFARQHALRAGHAKLLYADVDTAREACDHVGRTAAVHRLLRDATRGLQRSAYALLTEAAMPLISGHSRVDPYRSC